MQKEEEKEERYTKKGERYINFAKQSFFLLLFYPNPLIIILLFYSYNFLYCILLHFVIIYLHYICFQQVMIFYLTFIFDFHIKVNFL